MCASGSNIGEHQFYPQVKDTLIPSRSQFQSLEDSLWFQVKEDLESSNPSMGVQSLSFHDVGMGPLVGVPKGEDYEGKVDEGKGEEQVDYGSSPE